VQERLDALVVCILRSEQRHAARRCCLLSAKVAEAEVGIPSSRCQGHFTRLRRTRADEEFLSDPLLADGLHDWI
jgi:hypothetical protein